MSQEYRSVSFSETTLTELMIPAYANFGGKVHGGILLSLMDKIAYATATKHSGMYCVTVAVEGVEFLSPVEVGDLVTLQASVNYVGRSTMIVGIRVESMNPRLSYVRHTNSCYFTMAAKDEVGELTQVPGLVLQNETQLRRFYEGRRLKLLSAEKRKMLKAPLDDIASAQKELEINGERFRIEF
jgi:uncharacterized protein (TIGR00369 family)